MSKISRTLKEAYKDYPYRHKPKHKYHIDSATYFQIAYDINKEIMEFLMDTGKELKLPHGVGKLRVLKKKTPSQLNKKMIDWKKTKELGKVIYHKNTHSGEYYGKWYWDKRFALVKNKTLFNFDATRTNNRKLASKIKNENKIIKYFE